MKNRVYSAFSVACALALMLDYAYDQNNGATDTISYDESTDVTVTAGIITASTVDLSSIAEATVSDSDAVATASSAGALCGYDNIGICIVEEGNLNIRAEASTSGKLIGKFPKNAACEVVSTEGDWTYIKSGNVEGYVLSEYIVTGDEAEALADELAEYVATAKTGGLNIRTEMNTDCSVLAQMAEGEEVTVLEDCGDWIKVEVDGDEGYVFAEYVDVDLALNTAMTLAEARYGAGVSETRISLCDYALQFVGNPYVWGGTSLTNGADCSGFVLSIYAKYGVSLPHSSRAQANCGTRVSVSELQPGDLVFYGSGKSISHVAIYIGGGQIVHASNKRTGIKVSSVYYRTPICCTRIISD